MQTAPFQRVYARRLASPAIWLVVLASVLAVIPQSPILGPFLLVSEVARSFPVLLLALWIVGLVISALTWKTNTIRATILVIVLGPCSAIYTSRIWTFLPPLATQRAETPATTTLIDIAVVNVELGGTSPRQLRATLPARLPDILVVSEVTSDWINQAEFTSEYQFKVEAPGKSAEGTAVFSRFPLEGTKEISPGFFKTLGLTVRLTEHTILHLVALHAPPPQVDLSLEFRRAYFNLLDTYVSSLPTPDAVLLAGDFNTTPASDSYRTFVSRHSLRNVAEGRGLPNTWSLQFCPSVGAYIDQILHRGAVEVVDLRALDDFGSDHRPLLATLRISAR